MNQNNIGIGLDLSDKTQVGQLNFYFKLYYV